MEHLSRLQQIAIPTFASASYCNGLRPTTRKESRVHLPKVECDPMTTIRIEFANTGFPNITGGEFLRSRVTSYRCRAERS